MHNFDINLPAKNWIRKAKKKTEAPHILALQHAAKPMQTEIIRREQPVPKIVAVASITLISDADFGSTSLSLSLNSK